MDSSSKKRIAIIPARGGSKRIPRKNIKNFLGEPIICRVLSEISKSEQFDEIHVSTDCREIFDLVSTVGFPPGFFRDKNLAGDHANLASVINFVVTEMEKQGKIFDTIMMIFPTAFGLTADVIVDALASFENERIDIQMLSVAPFAVPVQWAMSRQPDGTLVPFFPDMLNVRSQDLTNLYFETADFVIYNASNYNMPDLRKKSYVVPYAAVDIDTEHDWKLAESLYILRTVSD